MPIFFLDLNQSHIGDFLVGGGGVHKQVLGLSEASESPAIFLASGVKAAAFQIGGDILGIDGDGLPQQVYGPLQNCFRS